VGERTGVVLVGLVAAGVALAATTVTRVERDGATAAAAAPEPLTATGAASDTVHPGSAVTGVLRITNRTSQPQRVSEVAFGSVTAASCARTGLVLAATVPPTPDAPLEVPAEGTATLEWSAFMDGTAEQACQGEVLRSEVVLDDEPAGEVTVTAGRLAAPEAPRGGLTTSTRAAVSWGATTAAVPGWVLERAVAGGDDWQPACGSSAARPLREPSCTDTGLAAATDHVYRLTLRSGHWHATSLPSDVVRTQDRPSA
jgi:hypothetical protein